MLPNNEMQRTRPGFARSLAAELSVGRTPDRQMTLTRLADRLRTLLHRSEAPRPDTQLGPDHYGQAVVESHYSPSKRYRAIITRGADGVFRVHREQWETSGWHVGGTPAWVPAAGGAHLSDTIERARSLAAEALRNVSEE